MNPEFRFLTGVGLAFGSLLLTGCGEMKAKVWPFRGETVQERSRTPANAVEYLCAAGKRFFVRTLEGGEAVWLILPEREVRLAKQGSRYGAGNTVLELAGNDATLSDGAAATYSACKTGGGEPPAAGK